MKITEKSTSFDRELWETCDQPQPREDDEGHDDGRGETE